MSEVRKVDEIENRIYIGIRNPLSSESQKGWRMRGVRFDYHAMTFIQKGMVKKEESKV